MPGKITPKRQSILGFEISGKLKKVVVDIGDEVNAGDLLAELEDSEALANYNEAKAKLSMFEKIFERSLSLNKDNFISDAERFLNNSLEGPISTICPKYITATTSHT